MVSSKKISRKIGRYQISDVLGRGGMGIVFLARDPFIDRKVAIKTTLAPPPSDPHEFQKFQDSFFHEARAAGKLLHPNIVSVYDAAIDKDRFYLVMEYVDGKTLRDNCEKGNLLPIEQTVKIIFQCAKALHYAHENGVIHRDIKPNNIMIAKNGSVKIADFGIATIEGAMAGPQNGQATWSIFYASPEQLREEPLTAQTDLFSLGVVLYELITGSKPFKADTEVGTFYKINYEDPPPIKSFRKDVPESLEKIISRALAKDPADRCQSGLQLSAELSASFDHLSMVEEEIGQTEKLNILKKLSFFNEFTSSELVEALRVTKWVKHRAGSVIITEGAIEDSFYVILTGEVVVKKKNKALALLKPGDCFGEMAYLGKTARTATTVARSPSMLMKINASVISQTSMTAQLSFYKSFTHTLIQRLTTTNKLLAGT